MNLKIASFNIKNGEKSKKEKNANILVNIIKKEKIDILGTQELTKEYEKTLKQKLTNYKFYGKYRYGNGILSKFKYNENNIIITNKKVKYNKTIELPWLANNFKDLKNSIINKSITPRIVTMITISDKELGKIIVFNTHLDYKIHSIKKRQLEKLKKIIFKYKKRYPTVLTGDFNMNEKDSDFKNFVLSLEEKAMKKVNIKNNTYMAPNGKKSTIDHIFIPKDWKIVESGIIDSEDISDHKPIYVLIDIEKKKQENKYVQIIKKAFKIK